MAVEQQLLARHVSTLLDKGFQQLMMGHRLGDLGRLHSLLARVNALDQLKAAWRDYISDKVVKIVKDEMNVSMADGDGAGEGSGVIVERGGGGQRGCRGATGQGGSGLGKDSAGRNMCASEFGGTRCLGGNGGGLQRKGWWCRGPFRQEQQEGTETVWPGMDGVEGFGG